MEQPQRSKGHNTALLPPKFPQHLFAWSYVPLKPVKEDLNLQTPSSQHKEGFALRKTKRPRTVMPASATLQGPA